jgi:hypothetical protein
LSVNEECPPGAQLMESMRAVGYSLATALADIIDNSISAHATNVNIHFSATNTEPYVAILDDGDGMSPSESRTAMQLAGNGVVSERSSTDLGRFGLGLKTASLSQGRRLTVVSIKDGVSTGLVWDLDHMIDTNSWSLIVLSDLEIVELAHAPELLKQKNGTLVLWNNLDRFHSQSREIAKELDSQMMDSKNHLSLIFHQFLNGDGKFVKVRMAINGMPLDGLDPFLSKSQRTQKSSVEAIDVENMVIDVQSFTLPFLNKMTPRERDLALAAGTLRDSQGFYIYRGGRLVIWGTWFRLMPKNDTGKLARVKVDIPNALDHLWSLDIKKSSAVPPLIVRERLRHLAGKMLEPSNDVHNYRGRKPKADDPIIRPWELIEDRDTFRYEINRNHPVFESLVAEGSTKTLRAVNEALSILEQTFPTQDLFNRMSNDRIPKQQNEDNHFLRTVLLDLWLTGKGREKLPDFVSRLTSIEPWDVFKDEKIQLEAWILENEEKIQ